MRVSSMKYISHLLLVLSFMLTACATAPEQPVVQKQKSVSPEVMEKYMAALRLMEQGSHDAALKVFAAVSKMDDALSGPYVNAGLIYLSRGHKDRARNAFEEALQRNAENPTALTQLAIFHREAYAFAEARENYEKALSVNASYVPAHLNLGILCDIYTRDYACALAHYEKYLELNGSDAEVQNWLIDLRERM